MRPKASYLVPDSDWGWLLLLVPDRELRRTAQPLRRATRMVLIRQLPLFTLLIDGHNRHT